MKDLKARHPDIVRTRDEIARITQLTGRSSADFQIVEGDISQPGLGLTPNEDALKETQEP